jgi:alanyl-tRNA synthetase
LQYVQKRDARFSEIAAALKAGPEEIEHRLVQVLENVKRLEKEVGRLKSKMAVAQGDDLADQALSVGTIKVLASQLEGADAKTLRETIDKLRDKLGSAVIVLGSADGAKVTLIAGITPDLTGNVKAGELVNFVAQQVGGKGGGRPDMAQAGGTDAAALPQALASVTGWVKDRLPAA